MGIPRWKEIADTIRADIANGTLSPGTALPPETKLAADWNVSSVTAHRALRELQSEGLVVRRRRAGTVVAPREARRAGTVAALFHVCRDYLENEYLAGIRAGLPDEYDLLFCATRGDPKRETAYLERMIRTTDGILCMPTCLPTGSANWLTRNQSATPLVCVDCVPEGVEVDAVVTDNYGASLRAIRFLASRGHRRIAHFTENRLHLSSVRERHDGYQEALRQMERTPCLRFVGASSDFKAVELAEMERAAHDALRTLWAEANRPTALFCVNDYVLSAALRACRDLQIAIPDDLEIVSFHDCPPLAHYPPLHVHRIVQRAYDMGRLAAELLCRRIAGESLPTETIRIAPDFHVAEANAP